MTQKSMLQRLKKAEIKKIFIQNNIQHLYLIGSYARWDQNIDSDIDLVYVHNGRKSFTLFDLFWLQEMLKKALSIESVDLVDEKAINKHYRPFIEKDKLLIF